MEVKGGEGTQNLRLACHQAEDDQEDDNKSCDTGNVIRMTPNLAQMKLLHRGTGICTNSNNNKVLPGGSCMVSSYLVPG